MKIFLALVALSLLAFSAPTASAQNLVVVAESSAGDSATRVVVRSTRLQRDFVLIITEPAALLPGAPFPAALPGSKPPVIYALDGGYGVVGPLTRLLSTGGVVEPSYVVSIDYPPGQPSARERDLLFRPVTENGRTYGGGGAAFQAFLLDELRPFIAARYPVDPERAVLFGHSFGGLFSANVLATRPDAFTGYVIASASSWRDEGLSQALQTFRPSGQKVFVGAGGQENARMLVSTQEIASVLQAKGEGLTTWVRVFPGENHISFYGQLTEAALRLLLPGPAIQAQRR